MKLSRDTLNLQKAKLVQVADPATGDLYDVWVKPQSMGAALDVMKIMGGEADQHNPADRQMIVFCSMAASLVDEDGEPIFTVDDILAIDPESGWFQALSDAYAEVNGAKKKT